MRINIKKRPFILFWLVWREGEEYIIHKCQHSDKNLFVNSVLNFIIKALFVEQCILQIYIKLVMTISKLDTKVYDSVQTN